MIGGPLFPSEEGHTHAIVESSNGDLTVRISALVIGAIVLVWLALGDPKNDVAGWLWQHSVAPWEQVDAFYYPDRKNLRVEERMLDVGSVENCRTLVLMSASARGDPEIKRGVYKCGIGYVRNFGGLRIYRNTVR